MTVIYILLAIVAVLSLVAVVLNLLATKKNKASTNGEDIKKEIADTVRMENSMLTGAVNAQAQATRDVTSRFDTFMVNVDRKLDDIKYDNARNLASVRDENTKTFNVVREETMKALEAVRKDNAEQLEKMRNTVDEKLASTLEQRFNDSFKLVGERLQEINTTFNALQGLQNDVNDLNKIFKNVKTRGTWGEVSLDNLLSQILTADQYVKQAQLSRSESEDTRVDFAIKLPGQGNGTVYLPIDAKFPIEDYQRLVDAAASGNVAAIDACTKALGEAVIKQGRSIRDKYVRPPKTTDFAIMYLPVEGLYAEIVRNTELLERLQRDCKVVICGPTTLSALLNSLSMGFRSVAIEKRSKEISVLLGQFQKDFGIFSKYLAQLKTRMGTVTKSIEDAEKKSNSIGSRLSKVTKIEVADGDVDLLEGLKSVDADMDVDFGENEEEDEG